MPCCTRPAGIILTLFFAACVAIPANAQVGSRNMTLESHRDDYVTTNGAGYRYSSCWSYVHQDGREYAVLGTAAGTAIYNITDPANPTSVGFIPGPNSVWRNMKSYRNWIYVVSEGIGAAEGMQIISMVDPENPVLVTTWNTTFTLAHTVQIDTTRGLLFANGTRSKTGPSSYPDAGLRILSLANPEAPVEWAPWPASGFNSATYVHDSFPLGNRLYAASINAGIARIIDTSVQDSLPELASWTYPNAFTHNVWTNDAETHLYATDETIGEPVKVFDITNINTPVLVNTFTPDANAVLHNVHVQGDELILAGYTSGVRLMDISDPAHPAEFAFADMEPDPSGGYGGVWEASLYYPSGTVIASDMNTGLYVYRPERANYGVVRAEVVDKDSQVPIEGASVYLSVQNDSLVTTAAGVARFGPSPGGYSVRAERFGYIGDSALVVVSSGSRDTLRLELELKPTGSFAGTVVDAVSTNPLPASDIALAYTPLAQQTDGAGAFDFPSVPGDIYRIDVSSPGHVPLSYSLLIDPLPAMPQTIAMHPADIHDDFELPSGWTIGAAGDDATSGIWERVEPLGTGAPPAIPSGAMAARRAPWARLLADASSGAALDREAVAAAVMAPGDIQPEFDRTGGAGQICFVTGQGTNPGSIGQNDVDNGRTSLVSPVYDVSGMADPYVGVWKWLYKNGGDEDWFAILVSDDGGASYAAVDTLRLNEPAWKEYTFRVSDHVAVTNQLRVKFVAADQPPGSILEAAVDDFMVWDDAAVTVAVPARTPGSRLAFSAPRPNPASGTVAFSLNLPEARDVEVAIYDIGGRRLRTLHRGPAAAGPLVMRWDGTDATGGRVSAGLYFAHARAGSEVARVRLVRIR